MSKASGVSPTATHNSTRKRQQRGIHTRERLLEAAARAFAENGFKGTSTRDIARRAGVHHPLITYHFKSKNDLWRAVVSRVFGRFLILLGNEHEALADATPRDRTAVLIREYVRFSAAHPELHKIMFQEASHDSPRMKWLIRSYLRPLYKAGVKDLKTLQDQGIAPRGDPAILYNVIRLSAAALLALKLEIKGTSGLDLGNTKQLDALADMLIRIYLSGQGSAR